MGLAFGGKCFTTQRDAAVAQCTTEFPLEWTNGTATYNWACTSVNAGATQLNLFRTQTGSTSTLTTTLAVSYPSCDELSQYSDMTALWLLLVCAAAIVWITKRFFWRLLANQ